MNLIRQIDNEIKPQWDEIKNGRKFKEFDKDCPPCLLRGWTDDNPSLWEIDNPDKPNLDKILFALCRRQKEWVKITYLVFNKNAIDSSNLSLTQTNGNTGDTKIDTSNSHYEVRHLSARSLCTLIYHIMVSDFEIGQYKKSEFDKILLNAYDSTPVIAQAKTDAMSIQPESIRATTNTLNKDGIIQVDKINKTDKSITSGSVDFLPRESPSTTS